MVVCAYGGVSSFFWFHGVRAPYLCARVRGGQWWGGVRLGEQRLGGRADYLGWASMWPYTVFLNQMVCRDVGMQLIGGHDCVRDGGMEYVLPPGWWDDVWGHAREESIGFIAMYEEFEGVGDEACISGREDVAAIVLSVCTWMSVEYYFVHVAGVSPTAGVVRSIRRECGFWEGLW